MKKIIALIMAVAMLATMCIPAFAEVGEFIESPSGVKSPKIIEFVPGTHECTANLVITSYAERNKLDDATKALLEKAYDDIASSKVINDALKTEFTALAEKYEVELSNFVVSNLFDVSYYECPEHAGHKGFTITIDAETADNYVGILHLNGETWEILDSTMDADAKTITFTTETLSPFALVYSTKALKTGDSSNAWIYVVLMTVSLAALGFVSYKLTRKEN